MKKLCVVLAVIAVSALASLPVAGADQPPARSFIARLDPATPGPPCGAPFNTHGLAKFQVAITESVAFRLKAGSIPDFTALAHIHNAPKGVDGPVVQHLGELVGRGDVVHGEGFFTNAALLAAIRANPQNYYVDVHVISGRELVCVRGQLDEHGPLNN
jgi:hypothetical protein